MKGSILPLLFFFCSLFEFNFGYQVGNDPFTREEWLDSGKSRYLLRWQVNWAEKKITFSVTAASTGWIAFGLSNNGTLEAGADLVIGGVRKSSTKSKDGKEGASFSDMHLDVGARVPERDRKQDWKLEDAYETGGTHTFLKFSRAFDTCDEDDYAITLNKVTLIWAYGKDDSETSINSFNYAQRGIYHTHLLDPDYAPEITRRSPNGDPILITKGRNEHVPEDTKAFTIRRSWLMATNETSYICSIHKGPRLQRKHHYIGFEMHFPDELSRKHTHHLMMYRCHPPRGTPARQFFESSLSNPGQPCYGVWNYGRDLGFPVQFCTEVYVQWAIGARAFFIPNHVGVPLGLEPDEYFLFELHYDNPERLPGLRVDAQMNFFYTGELRPNEGGVMAVSVTLPGLPENVLVPPNSQSHRIMSHCSPHCTEKMWPEGITIPTLTLHSHNAGVGVRLRHFRGGKELPWILYDDNFDNLVQPFRNLREERRILPGDQLTMECHYSTNGTAVSGFSTRQEMCNAIYFYYNRRPGYISCRSGIVSPEARERILGIQNASWIQDELEWVVNSPRELAGLKVSEISDRLIDWTPERRRGLQRFHEVAPQTGYCFKDVWTRTLEEYLSLPSNPPGMFPEGPRNTPEEYIGPVGYPFESEPYNPPQSSCHPKRG